MVRARGSVKARLPRTDDAEHDNFRMNPLLARLHPYPFERLRALTADIAPNPAYAPIGLGIGEPRHATPALVKSALAEGLDGLAR